MVLSSLQHCVILKKCFKITYPSLAMRSFQVQAGNTVLAGADTSTVGVLSF